jgi:hypothetical protein
VRAARLAAPIVLGPVAVLVLSAAAAGYRAWFAAPLVLVIVAGWLAAGKGWPWLPASLVGAFFGLAIATLLSTNWCRGMNSGPSSCVPQAVPFPTEVAGLVFFGILGAAQALTFGGRGGGWWILANAVGGLGAGVAVDLLDNSPLIAGLCWGIPVSVAAYLITRAPRPAPA